MATKAKTFAPKQTTVVTPPEVSAMAREITPPKPKYIPTFRKKNKEFTPTIYTLVSNAKKRNGMPQYPIVSLLKAEDIIFDPSSGENKKIKFCPGETSIFESEQSKQAKMREPISFNNGFLFVDHTNPTLKKYLDTCNSNGSNPNRIKSKSILFFVKDDEASAKDKIKQVGDVMEAVQSALKMPLNELVGYAKVLGVSTNKSSDEIRWDMKIIAEKSPTAFLSGLNDPRTEMKQLLLIAQDTGIISMKSTGITWIASGNTICVPAIGIKAIDRMVDYCSQGEGEEVYAEIERRLQAING